METRKTVIPTNNYTIMGYIICAVIILIGVYTGYLLPSRPLIQTKVVPLIQISTSISTSTTTVKVNTKPLFVVTMASYTRANGRSPYFLDKSVRSLLGQTYSNWQLFITGVKYENETEFQSLFSNIPSSKLFLNNLAQPEERNNLTGMQLWQSGSVAAMNNALIRAEKHHDYCRANCNIYFTNLNDDDIWSPEHLKVLLSIFTRFPSVVFTWTKGYYCGNGGNPFPPAKVVQDRTNNWGDSFGGNILHSSWSWKMENFRGFRYRGQWDFPPSFQGPREADVDLFEVIHEHVLARKLRYFHSNEVTIEHLVDGGQPCQKNGTLWYPDRKKRK